MVEGNLEASTTEPRIARFNDNEVGNLVSMLRTKKYFMFFHEAEE